MSSRFDDPNSGSSQPLVSPDPPTAPRRPNPPLFQRRAHGRSDTRLRLRGNPAVGRHWIRVPNSRQLGRDTACWSKSSSFSRSSCSRSSSGATWSVDGSRRSRGIGTSIILIAAGAILRFAVTLQTAHVNWNIVGDVLMVAGGVGLLLSMFWMATASRRGSTTVIDR